MHLDPPPTRCGACDAPAVIRFALVAPDELPAAAIARRPQYRCPACSPLRSPDWIAGARTDALDWLVVVDPAFTRELLDPRCGCGLPADHRDPVSGEPRPCLDETARIALPTERGSRPPVPNPPAVVIPFSSREQVEPPADVRPPVELPGGMYVPADVADALEEFAGPFERLQAAVAAGPVPLVLDVDPDDEQCVVGAAAGRRCQRVAGHAGPCDFTPWSHE